LAGGVKKWFMLQMWRIQQVAQIITIVLLAFNLALLLQTKMDWREGTIWADTYAGVFAIMLVLVLAIWVFALAWDLWFKMWREQQTVLAERNPYAKEKLTSKEIAIYSICWLPLLEQLGKTDPDMKKAAVYLRTWLEKAYNSDPIATEDLKDIMDYLGNGRSMPFNLVKK
jgi:hypothetical protein